GTPPARAAATAQAPPGPALNGEEVGMNSFTSWTYWGYNVHFQTEPAGCTAPSDRPGGRPSGDWADLVAPSPGSIVALHADLMGKGTGAGPYRRRLAAQLRTAGAAAPASLLQRLHAHWPEERFVALTVLAVDAVRHQFRLALAGQ